MSKQKIPTVDSKTGYNLIAKQYKKMHNYLNEFEDNKLMPLLGNIKGERVLDVGCGTGRLIRKLIDAGAVVTALDISEKMLQEVKKRYVNVDTVVGDAEKLSFPDNFFDVVVSTFVIVHLTNPTIFFQEAYRVLKDNGKFLIGNIHQKEPVPMSVGNKSIQVESYYHSQEEVVDKLEELAFKVEKQEVIKENDTWINQIVLASK